MLIKACLKLDLPFDYEGFAQIFKESKRHQNYAEIPNECRRTYNILQQIADNI